MNDAPAMPPQIEFKDRSTGLLLFGILEILLGGLCGLLVPLVILGQLMSARIAGGALNLRMAIPGVMMYGLLAIAFIWLGIGSIQCRRWARALWLVLSWSWLAMGVTAVASLLYIFPKMMDGSPPEGRWVALVVAGFVWAIIFLVVPGALVVFYQSRHVKATCDARDPLVRWTDACPLPVLAVAIWLGFGAVAMLAMPPAYNSVLPFFGVLLAGLPGTVAFWVLTAAWACLAWAWYRLKLAAWWITVAMLMVMMVSGIVTFSRVDLMDMYRLMGYPPEQLVMIEQFNFLTSQTMVWWSAGCLLPMMGYLIWVKRFFRGAG